MDLFTAIPAVIYLVTGIWCFYLGQKGLKSMKLIFPKGTKGTPLENNKTLIWAQIIGAHLLGFCLLWYAAWWAAIFITKLSKTG